MPHDDKNGILRRSLTIMIFGLLLPSIGFRGREKKRWVGLGLVNQARGPSAAARQARGPSAAARQARGPKNVNMGWSATLFQV